ncbi:MAG: aminotransferase class I/II-fold pyridoxal phosphate-dependent enzyme, partial [Marinobacter sp.]|nr:aminotransferase class I/II-fold pyridoxal phosphate-dependent enzyme [Marinobacter sp.]
MTFCRDEHVWIPESDLEGMSVDTLAVRAGQIRTGQLEHSDPIFPTSSFVYGSAAQAAARFGGEEPGNIYSRFTNPTVQAFEARIAAMEGGEKAVATSSGMAAILSTCMALLKSGDHVVCSRGVFGTTNVLFQKYMAKFGVETSFVSLTDQAQWEREIRPETRMLFIETPSNPLCEVADMAALAALAHANDALFVVDNCFCTPVLQRPLEHGAD